jgi:hypothetical protein
MLANEILPILVRYWPIVTISVVAAFLLNNKYWKGLNKYPGHWAAGYSNWWRLWDVKKRNHQWTTIALHRKHGDVVRLGPNVLSFADPKAIKTIYGLNKGVSKVCCGNKLQKGHALIFSSPTSTLFKAQSPKVNRSSHSSLPLMRTSTQSTVDASTMPLP